MATGFHVVQGMHGCSEKHSRISGLHDVPRNFRHGTELSWTEQLEAVPAVPRNHTPQARYAGSGSHPLFGKPRCE
jgi:hypothetical protein